jgi:probable rRNA maturation factor
MIRINVFNTHPRYRGRRAESSRFARTVLRGEGIRDADVGIVFTGDRTMLRLNRTYLRHHYQTDVLTFPLSDNPKEGLDGEIYINLEQARRQARTYRVPAADEVARLVAHGILHLTGYSDHTVRERHEMTAREDYYLKRRR